MKKLEVTYVNPRDLLKNNFNPNVVDAINQDKILNSIRRETFFRPILVRELESGDLEIIGGEHRNDAAVDLGMDEVPVINLGKMPDAEAKRKCLLDNSSYGENDIDRLTQMLADEGMGSAEELLAILPIDEAELAGLFDSCVIDLDNLEYDDIEDIEFYVPVMDAINSSQIIRFKVQTEDAAVITSLINRIKSENGFTRDDDLTNAGDALIWLCRDWEGHEKEDHV